uniref:multidrug and toxin extrusion protein 1-like n=1 Tax=Myxine glutinosa TaxID=7769 RepID=UPI00358EA0A6
MLQFTLGMISIAFSGHLGIDQLNGVSLAMVVINVTGLSVAMGMTTTCDTVLSQSFGSGNLKHVGVIMQRSVIIMTIVCILCLSVLINTELLLLALQQDHCVARLAKQYVDIFCSAMPAFFLFQLEAKYLMNQKIIIPQVLTALASNAIHVLLNYVLLYVLETGIMGAAIAHALNFYFQMICLIIYIWWRGCVSSTWGGWSIKCLEDWWPYMTLAIPSTMMICLEWWIYEIATILSGILGKTEQAAQSTIYQLSTITYTIPMGVSIAATVQVGNALGAGKTEQAKLSAKVSLVCALFLSAFNALILVSLKDVLGYLFSNDLDVVKMVAFILPLCAGFQLFDGLSVVAGGILRGCALQKIGALCCLIGYYFIGIPIGISLMFLTDLHVFGMWIGLFISIFMQCVFMLFSVIRVNWESKAEQAQVNAGTTCTQNQYEETESRNRGTTLSDSNCTESGVEEQPKVTAVPEDQRDNQIHKEIVKNGISTFGNGDDRLAVKIQAHGILEMVQIKRKVDNEHLEEGPPMLSLKRLLFYRGLFFLAALGIFALGMVIRFVVPRFLPIPGPSEQPGNITVTPSTRP